MRSCCSRRRNRRAQTHSLPIRAASCWCTWAPTAPHASDVGFELEPCTCMVAVPVGDGGCLGRRKARPLNRRTQRAERACKASGEDRQVGAARDPRVPPHVGGGRASWRGSQDANSGRRCGIATAWRDTWWREAVRSLLRSPEDPLRLRLSRGHQSLGRRRCDEAMQKQCDQPLTTAIMAIVRTRPRMREDHGQTMRRNSSPPRSCMCTRTAPVHDERRPGGRMTARTCEACTWMRRRVQEFCACPLPSSQRDIAHTLSQAVRDRGPRIARVSTKKCRNARGAHGASLDGSNTGELGQERRIIFP